MENKVREYELEIKKQESEIDDDEDMYKIEGSFFKGILNALLLEGLILGVLVVIGLLISLI